MKYICKHACIWRGVYVAPDTVIDMTDEEMKEQAGPIGSSFVPLQPGERAKKEKAEERDEAGMTLEDYRQRLTGMNVPFSPTAGIDELRKLLRQHTSTQSRKIK